MNIILLGAPGTGKGTQSDLLVKRFKLYHISTGDVFRHAIRQKTALGRQAASYMNKGQLVPDFIVTGMVKEIFHSRDFMQKAAPGFILDGFPRTLHQAESLGTLLHEAGLSLNAVLCLNVSESHLVERATGRRVAPKSGRVYHLLFHPPEKPGVCDITGEALVQRKDDTKEIVQQRLLAYQRQTAPLIAFYRKKKHFTRCGWFWGRRTSVCPH